MAGRLLRAGLLMVALLAVVFQVYLKQIVWLGFGIGRVVQPLSDFPYTCRKIEHPEMESCEDMWLSETTRQLFLACSDPDSRRHWLPNTESFNVSARSLKDAIVALHIDKPVGDGFELRSLKTSEFSGTAGDGLLSLAGFTGIEDAKSGLIHLFVVNNRPSVDSETGKHHDQWVSGANSTIDVFTTTASATELKFVRTYADKHIATPNRVAAVNSSSFYITNDHGKHKHGLQRHLSPVIGSGDVTFCSLETGCNPVVENLKFPNGLARGKDGLIYVPSSVAGTIGIFESLPGHGLQKIDEIKTGYSIDNISVDKNGELFVALFPVGFGVFKAFDDPWGSHPASAAMRVSKNEDGYQFEKAIEDGLGEVLPAATTVVHDAKTGRFFFSSVISPWIAVCEPNA